MKLDQPDVIGDFPNADGLTGKDLAEVDSCVDRSIDDRIA